MPVICCSLLKWSRSEHFSKNFGGATGTVVVDITDWSDIAKADVLSFLDDFGFPEERWIVIE